MKFVLDESQNEKANEWIAKHDCNLRESQGGAIGGKTTYEFTPTGLGVIAFVICACGKKRGLTSFEDW